MLVEGYRIVRKIGQGGMAAVYLAIQVSLNREVALKVLTHGRVPDFSKRFLREARMIASLTHAHVVTIYDIGIDQDHHYISMEYLTGGDLKSRISHGISPVETFDIVDKIADALQTAHEKGIIHRDVKPANILFREDGTPLLTDFGVAKIHDTTTLLTKTGSILGTPAYLSPEQAHGTSLDGRGDMYSLGIVLYEMLTGKRPYEGDSDISTIFKHAYDPLPVLPEQHQHLQPFLDKLLAKRPEDRFDDMAAMRLALRRAIHTTPREKRTDEHSVPVKSSHGSDRHEKPNDFGSIFRTSTHKMALAVLAGALVVVAFALIEYPGPVPESSDSTGIANLRSAERNVPEHTPVAIRSAEIDNEPPKPVKIEKEPPKPTTKTEPQPGTKPRAVGYYIDLVEEQLRRRNYTQAQRFIDEGLHAYPGNPRLRALNRRVKLERTSRKALRSVEKFADDIVERIKDKID